ncbi:nitrate reductase gamma subunit [Desulfitobacterium sp.]|uniref:nitrate reductase gamma subunit n=1 Tax=Desulfitobacterium sp. TaxID=49981 RepID=UPI002B208D61|nr:nitrate reductase gamma subunit [Desulfitobacterium sp.]MEA4901556.1 nitrate reductase gamma subunit [Desulfitobacterium sp.]
MVLVIYAIITILLFLVLSANKAKYFAQMPLHGRQDLYPIPKEKGHEYGGSYYEQVGWWKKPRETSASTELADMLKEMLFIKKLFDNQRPFWWLSYALHLGIYCIMGWTVLLLIGAITELAGGNVAASGSIWGMLLFYVTPLFGWVGLILAAFGSASLFIRRLVDSTLKKHTTPQEYFNLLLLFAVVVTGIAVWGNNASLSGALGGMKNVISLKPLNASPLLTLHIVLLGIMYIYIPLSKMSHYVGKYFTFHKVIWENEPNLPGGKIEEQMKKAAHNKPQHSWSAPHIKG